MLVCQPLKRAGGAEQPAWGAGAAAVAAGAAAVAVAVAVAAVCVSADGLWHAAPAFM
jgi:hypothetical protein